MAGACEVCEPAKADSAEEILAAAFGDGRQPQSNRLVREQLRTRPLG
jgi:hypothetical protein